MKSFATIIGLDVSGGPSYAWGINLINLFREHNVWRRCFFVFFKQLKTLNISWLDNSMQPNIYCIHLSSSHTPKRQVNILKISSRLLSRRVNCLTFNKYDNIVLAGEPKLHSQLQTRGTQIRGTKFNNSKVTMVIHTRSNKQSANAEVHSTNDEILISVSKNIPIVLSSSFPCY